MKVLSLFDGMACGMLAMQKAGIQVDRYVAFEIDKYAVQTSSHNFPMIEHRGDVFQADFTEFSGFDFLVGGSPCTYWSIAQKNNRETEASGMGWELFSQYIRALHEARPMYFIYENNKSMSAAIRASIDKAFGFDAICINSALVSAQNRQRLYWVGKRNPDGTYSKVHVDQPEDRGILLKDVLESITGDPSRIPAYGADEKSRPLNANYSNNCGGFEQRMFSENPKKQQVDMVAVPVGIGYRGRMENGKWVKQYESNEEPKSNALTTCTHDSMVAEPVAINTTADGDKARTLMAGYYKYGTATLITNEGFTGGTTAVAEPVCMRYERSAEAKAVRKQYEAGEIHHGFHELSELHPRTDGKSNTLSTVLKDNPICEPVRVGALPRPNGELSTSQAFRIYSADGKSVNITAGGGGAGGKTGLYAIPIEFDNDTPIKAISCADGKEYTVYEVKDGLITIKEKQYPIKLADGYYIIRKLTVTECKRLQTVPESYDFPVSDTQAYKMLGNGWTVDVIAHLISATQTEQFTEEQLELWGVLV